MCYKCEIKEALLDGDAVQMGSAEFIKRLAAGDSAAVAIIEKDGKRVHMDAAMLGLRYVAAKATKHLVLAAEAGAVGAVHNKIAGMVGEETSFEIPPPEAIRIKAYIDLIDSLPAGRNDH